MTTVNRTSGTEKVSGLMNKTGQFCFEATHLRSLNGMCVSITIYRMQIMEYLNILIAIAINLLGLFDIVMDSKTINLVNSFYFKSLNSGAEIGF